MHEDPRLSSSMEASGVELRGDAVGDRLSAFRCGTGSRASRHEHSELVRFWLFDHANETRVCYVIHF